MRIFSSAANLRRVLRLTCLDRVSSYPANVFEDRRLCVLFDQCRLTAQIVPVNRNGRLYGPVVI